MGSLFLRLLIAATFLSIARADAQTDVVRLRWLGVAGFSIVGGNTTLVFDPYFSRYSLPKLATSSYCPDGEALHAASRRAPELTSADAILIGHSHFDHLGDAPWIAARSGAPIYGSETTTLIARAYASADRHCPFPAQNLTTKPFDPPDTVPIPGGQFSVQAIASCHGHVRVIGIPFPGIYDADHHPPAAPFAWTDFRLGDTRAYVVEHRATKLRILLTSSGCLEQEHLAGVAPVHVVLAAAPEDKVSEYAGLIATLDPAFVVPHHYESFFRRNGTRPRIGMGLDRFEDALEDADMTVHFAKPFQQLCVSRVGQQTRLAECSDSARTGP